MADDVSAFAQGDVFSDQTFSRLDLSGPEPRGRRFEACRFVECRITARAFRTCAFLHCVFDHCDLSNWDVEGLRLVEAEFRESKLVGIEWAKLKADPLTSFDFEDCMLDFADFSRVKQPRLSLVRCSARGANFEDADLRGANLRDSDLAEARFSHTELSDADLRGARGYAIDPRDNRLKGAKLSLPEALNLLSVMEIKVYASDEDDSE